MTPIEEILKKNNLSITGSRQKIMQLFMDSNGALAHADIEKKTGEYFDSVLRFTAPCNRLLKKELFI